MRKIVIIGDSFGLPRMYKYKKHNIEDIEVSNGIIEVKKMKHIQNI